MLILYLLFNKIRVKKTYVKQKLLHIIFFEFVKRVSFLINNVLL